jgi:hypothetical protein
MRIRYTAINQMNENLCKYDLDTLCCTECGKAFDEIPHEGEGEDNEKPSH